MSVFESLSHFLTGASQGYKEINPVILNTLLYRQKVKDQKMRHKYMQTLMDRMNSKALENYLRNRFKFDNVPSGKSIPRPQLNNEKLIKNLLHSDIIPKIDPHNQTMHAIGNWLSKT